MPPTDCCRYGQKNCIEHGRQKEYLVLTSGDNTRLVYARCEQDALEKFQRMCPGATPTAIYEKVASVESKTTYSLSKV